MAITTYKIEYQCPYDIDNATCRLISSHPSLIGLDTVSI